MKGLFRREERQTTQGATWEEHLRADSTKKVGARREHPQALAQVMRGFFSFGVFKCHLITREGKKRNCSRDQLYDAGTPGHLAGARRLFVKMSRHQENLKF